ncbi:MAG: hypothetical protein J1F42_04780 [Lachnospiraceae bacterium]|nr:hypothetical protein [Lachnospiraceae bacterium]
MNYIKFTETIAKLLRERMGVDYEVKVTEVTKNNGVQLTGVVMMRKSDKISPTIYLEEPYRQYLAGVELQEIVDRIVELYREQMKDFNLDIDSFKEFEFVRDRIFHKMINYEKNRKLLEDIPYIKWCDLAVVFYYAVEEKFMGRASILIHNNHLVMWEQTVDELYRIAQHNMRQSMPELLMPMQNLVEEMTGVKLQQTDEIRMYVLTNRAKLNGASAMLYSDKIRELAEWLQSDLMILPSSVHEVLLLPDDHEQEYAFYRQMVEEVNTTQVDPEEILSYSLYRYSRKKAEIEEISG